MDTITVKLSEALRQRVERESRRRGISRSAYVRGALEKVLAQESDGALVSCYDAMKDGAGMVREAPPDLSTDRRHLEGFGR